MAKSEKASFWSKVAKCFKIAGVKTAKFFKKLWFRICGFCVRTYQEMRRMRWPGKKALTGALCIVLSFIFVFGLYIVFDDFVIAQIFKLINY